MSSSKDEDDVYEFKSTPKDSSSSCDDKSDGGKNSDKSSDEKSDDPVPSQKRTYSDLESNDDTAGSSVEDDVKRKKRKDGDQASKETSSSKSSAQSSRNTPQRSEKGSKLSGGPNKNLCLSTKIAASLDRKSPCSSPKPSNKSNDSDGETDENKSGDGFGSGGPKVPPLKIVIPQQSTGNDQETGTRNGKNASARSHAALPYVVPSSSNSNDSADKESGSSRCTSPSDSAKSTDDKKGSSSGTVMTNEEQRQQRVLRSSHRGGQSVDRGSNNSSPQLQNSSPPPAPATGSSNEQNEPSTKTTNIANNGNTSTVSPVNPSATISDTDANTNAPSPSASSTSSSTKETAQSIVDLHPRKRKIRASKDDVKQSAATSANTVNNPAPTAIPNTNSETVDSSPATSDIHPHDQPITNCYQMYLNIRQQIDRRHRTLFPVQPKPPQGFKDYLMNRATYALAGKTPNEPLLNIPGNLTAQMKDLFTGQEKERHKLKMQHVVEKEKLVLSVEQEILRVHGRAARALANQSLPFSVCTILKDEEVYNMITPEQEEKDRNARSRYNGRLFISWLQDVDDKWEKIKVITCFYIFNVGSKLFYT